MAQEGLPSSFSITPFTPTHHFLSFTEFLLRNAEEWSKPHSLLPPPPPPIAFSGSDRFLKGRLPHRTVAISASLSSLLDDSTTSLFDVSNHGDLHADKVIVKRQKMICEAKIHGNDDRAPAASTQCNTSIDAVSLDNAQQSNASVQSLSSNEMGDVSACGADNSSEGKAPCMCPQDGRSPSANESADIATCDTFNLLPDEPQHAHGSDDVIFQLLSEDDGRVQPSNKDGVDCSPCTTKEIKGSAYVPDIDSPDKSGQHMKIDEEGSEFVAKTPVDAIVGHSLPLECKSSLPLPILTCDADGVAELSLPSLSKSPNDSSLIGHMGGAPQLSPSFRTKSHNNNIFIGDAELPSPTKYYDDNNLTGCFLSSSKCFNDNNLKGDMSAVPELSLLSITRRHDDNFRGDADRVTKLSMPSVMNSFENATRAAEGLPQLSLPSPQKSNNAYSLTGNAEGVPEIQLLPLTKSHDVNALQNTVIEAPIVLQQNEQVQDLEEGELSERLLDGKCFEISEDSKTIIGEGDSHPLNTALVESKVFESSTDDEMNQPISLFISRYRTRSSVKLSNQKMPLLDTDSNIKKKLKTGSKRKIEEQEQMLKEVMATDMAIKGKLKQVKGVQRGPNKVARVLNNNGGGLLGVASKVSVISKIDMSAAKDDVEKQHPELGAAQAGRDQVMGTPAVVLYEKEDGASRTHGKGLTQHGLAGSENCFALEKTKVCVRMGVEEGLSTVDVGNDQNFSKAEVAMRKPKRKLTAERKKKKQKIKHRKAYERGAGRLRLKPCVDKQKEKKACRFYVRGKCGKGASCPFSHDIPPITKSEMCKYFINHCCLKGDDCPYSHALSTFPCKYFHTRGKCMEADSCRFSHEPISEEAKQKLLAKIEQEQQVREANKVTDNDSFGRINPKYAVLPSDLELFPLGGKHANKTLLKVTDAAASKVPCLDTTGTSSTHTNIREIAMLVAAKKTASTLIGGDSSVNATNLEGNKSLLHGSFLDPTVPLADKNSEKRTTPTTKYTTRQSGVPLAQTTGFSSNSTMTQERKTKVDAFLQAQLDNSHLMRKSKLGTGLENSGGCYTLSNQPRALSMGQTSLLKAPNTSASRDPNAKPMGLPHASVDDSQLMPTSKATICAGTKTKSDILIDQGKSLLNIKSVGIDTSVPNPTVLGPSLLDLVSMSQGATFLKGRPASTSGLLSTTINATPKRSTANVFLDRFLKG